MTLQFNSRRKEKQIFFFLTPLKVSIYKTRAGIKRLRDAGLPSLCSGVCDSYRKRQRNVAERTESAEKERGRLGNGRGKGGGFERGEARGPKEYDLCATGQRSKER